MGLFVTYVVIFFGLLLILLIGKRMDKSCRASRDAVAAERAYAQLRLGETLLYVGRTRESPGAIVCYIIFGLMSCLTAIFSIFITVDKGLSTYLISGVFVIFGLCMVYTAFFMLLKEPDNYFYVTNQRLSFRGSNWAWRRIETDYLADKIQDVKIVRRHVYGMHIRDWVRVYVDKGNGKSCVFGIDPENDPALLANAIMHCKIKLPKTPCEHFDKYVMWEMVKTLKSRLGEVSKDGSNFCIEECRPNRSNRNGLFINHFILRIIPAPMKEYEGLCCLDAVAIAPGGHGMLVSLKMGTVEEIFEYLDNRDILEKLRGVFKRLSSSLRSANDRPDW